MGFLSPQTHEFKGEHKVGWILYNKTKSMQQPFFQNMKDYHFGKPKEENFRIIKASKVPKYIHQHSTSPNKQPNAWKPEHQKAGPPSNESHKHNNA